VKRIALLLFIAVLSASAQNSSTYGNITRSASACTLGSGSGYVWFQLPANTGSVSVAISGTWSATVQFQGSVDGTTWTSITASPQPSGAAVISTAANGTWSVAASGLAYVCVYASAYTSGTAVVNMAAISGGGGGSTTGTPSSPVGSVQVNNAGTFGALAIKATTQAPSQAQFIFKGDSLTRGEGLTVSTQSYPSRFGNCATSGSPPTCIAATTGKSFAGPSATIVNLGVNSETLQTALANYTTEVHPYCIQATATVPVFLHLEEGINDIRVNSASAATIEGYLTSYWAGAVADGCTVTAATLTPTGDMTAAGEATRLAVNEWIRSQINLYSYLDDLAQFLPASNNTVWYQGDTIHYTAAAASQIANNINGIWSGKFGFQTMEPLAAFNGWVTTTPTPTCLTGTATAISSVVDALIVNKTAWVNLSITLTTTGTCNGTFIVTLPFTTATAGPGAVIGCRERVNSGKTYTGTMTANSSSATFVDYNNAVSTAAGQILVCTSGPIHIN